ncbi:hypothetical protein [Corallococcus exiguus]|uniref:hypothetical protein n=1 Tax=Corallococcus exiguus TaxID=83462 RepID=UPI0014944736|nr:hypothetical protein [Corallococcus exiguus]NPD29774.1 hypothetical protein [Corallococcus exiguus]
MAPSTLPAPGSQFPPYREVFDAGAATQTAVQGRLHQGARTYRLRAKDADLPLCITLLFDGKDKRAPSQLLVGQVLVPTAHWGFDLRGGTLHWRFWLGQATHSGLLRFEEGGATATGFVSEGGETHLVTASLPPITYECAVAQQVGGYVTGQPPALQLHYDASSPAWSHATWVPSAFQFTYQMRQQIIVGQEFWDFYVSFNDAQTGVTWTPSQGTFGALVDANMVFTLSVAPGVAPPSDNRQGLTDPASRAITTVFPFQFSFQLSPTALELTGTMLTVVDAQNGVVLGVQGQVANPSVAGYYALDGAGLGASFAVHEGGLHIGAAPVEATRLRRNALSFSGLSPAQQAAGGLPAAGTLEFSDDGSRVRLTDGASGARLGADSHVARQALRAGTSPLNLQTLALMNPFEQQAGPDGTTWVDAVQQASMADFNQILLYFMDPQLRRTYWSQNQPVLSPALQRVAAMAPAGSSPAEWYGSLSVSFLTDVLSTWDQPGANTLNAARAQTWLKEQVAASEVFRVQAPALYQLEWANRFPAINDFLTDQRQNAASYTALIADDAAAWKTELAQDIADPASLQAMQSMVDNLAATAEQSALYWAYTYFRYATQPQAFSELEFFSLGPDGSAFMRRVQTDMAVLASLDSSNLFAQQYAAAVNTMLYGNVVPSLADYGGGPGGMDGAVAQVLQGIASDVAGSSDPVLARIGDEARSLAARSDLPALVASVQAAAAGCAAGAGWSTASPAMQASVEGSVGTLGSQLLCLSLAGLNTSAVVHGVADFGPTAASATAAVSPGTIVSAVKYTVQVAYVFVKWGVIFANALDSYATTWSAVRALFTTEMLNAANAAVDTGLTKWLIGNRIIPQSEMFGSLFDEAAAQGETVVTRIFGRNLDSFVGLRLGAVFALASLIAGAFALAHSDTLDEKLVSALSVTSSALSLIATAGGWITDAFGVTEFGGLAVSTLFGVFSVLSILAAVAGVVLLLVQWWQARPSPVQTFATTYAQPAGFYMPYGSAIDAFTGYTPPGGLARLGVSLAVPGGRGAVLRVAGDGTLVSGPLDHGYATVFFPSTDGQGRSQLVAFVGGGDLARAFALTGASGGVSFQPLLASSDPAAATQLWTLTLEGDPTWDGKAPESGPFTLTLVGTDQSLVWTGHGVALGASGSRFTLQQQPMVPLGLSMRDVTLYTFSQGASFIPRLAQAGSAPQTWAISPALPAFLSLDTATGVITEPLNAPQPLPVTPAGTYVLSVMNSLLTRPIQTAFALQVLPAPSSTGTGTELVALAV